MGYATQYRFSVIEGDDNLVNEFRKENDNAEYAFDEDGSFNCECKWYDHEKDLKNFSLKHPDALFLLEGVGEDSGDEWRLYVKEGQSQVCRGEMVFPAFDRGKLLADIRDNKLKQIGI